MFGKFIALSLVVSLCGATSALSAPDDNCLAKCKTQSKACATSGMRTIGPTEDRDCIMQRAMSKDEKLLAIMGKCKEQRTSCESKC